MNLKQTLKDIYIIFVKWKEKRSKNNLAIKYFHHGIAFYNQALSAENIEEMSANLNKSFEMYIMASKIMRENGLIKNLDRTLTNLGVVYQQQAIIGKNPNEHLLLSVEVFKESARIAQDNNCVDDELCFPLSGLSNTYIMQALLDENASENIELAFESIQKVIDIRRRRRFWSVSSLARNLNTLGLIQQIRAEIGKFPNENILSSIDSFQEAIKIQRSIFEYDNLLETLSNLGASYIIKSDISKNGNEDLTLSIDAFLEAARICRKKRLFKKLSMILNNLGIASREQAQIGEDTSENIKFSIDIFLEAKYIQQENGWNRDLARTLSNLSLSYACQAHFHENKHKSINHSIDCLQEAAKIQRDNGWNKDLSNTLGNLAFTYTVKASDTELSEDPEADRLKAVECYRETLQFYHNHSIPANCLKVGRGLGNIGFKQGDWLLAIEGYELAMEAIEQIRHWEREDTNRQKIIIDSLFIYENAIQAYINLEQLDKAITTTERARSRWLVGLMASNNLYRQGQVSSEVQQYLDRYHEIQRQIDLKQIQIQNDIDQEKKVSFTKNISIDFESISIKLNELYEEKSSVWKKINHNDRVIAAQIEVQLLSYSHIQQLIPNPNTAILSFYNTATCVHVFIIRTGKIEVHTCPTSGSDLNLWIIKNWLVPYKKYPKLWEKNMNQNLAQISSKLQLEDLVLQYLNEIEELIIIPHRGLHLIPFAALPVKDGRHLGDIFRLRYAPSAQVLDFCDQRQPVTTSDYGIIENATSDLIWASYECNCFAELYRGRIISHVQREQATVTQVQTLLGQRSYLHASHHADSNLEHPLESALQLSDGRITLGQLMFCRFPELEEIFLSCCETNFSNPNVTDDLITIGTGFLCAGARSVISTLWSVYDLSTAFFCLEYYQARQTQTRAEAIQTAQQQIRSMTGEQLKAKLPELKAYFNEQIDLAETDGNITLALQIDEEITKLEKMTKKDRPFESPVYWAAFICQGLS